MTAPDVKMHVERVQGPGPHHIIHGLNALNLQIQVHEEETLKATFLFATRQPNLNEVVVTIGQFNVFLMDWQFGPDVKYVISVAA